MTDELGIRLQAMEAEDARLLAIIEALDEGIIAVDGRGEVVRMNEAARRLFGSRAALPFPSRPPARCPASVGDSGRKPWRAERRRRDDDFGPYCDADVAAPAWRRAVLAVMDLTERGGWRRFDATSSPTCRMSSRPR